MFGKLMSIGDDLMWSYYELLTDLTPAGDSRNWTNSEVASERVACACRPKKLRLALAMEIIAGFLRRTMRRSRAAEECDSRLQQETYGLPTCERPTAMRRVMCRPIPGRVAARVQDAGAVPSRS